MSDEIAPLEKWLKSVAQVYKKGKLESDFSLERKGYEVLLPKLEPELAAKNYQLVKCIGLGSTASIWIVSEKGLQQQRVLKIARPRLSRLKDIIKVIQGERDRLATLNHENIVKIYAIGAVEQIQIAGDLYEFPYFVMDYLDGVQNLGDFFRTNSYTLDKVCRIFHGVLSGLEYLHSMGIVHCDIKPENILIAPSKPPLVTDFGYSKHLPRIPNDPSKTGVTFTKKYAHPELIEAITTSYDPNATFSSIPREKLRPAFDLFSLGMTLREVLKNRPAEPASSDTDENGSDPYRSLYLSLISKRLRDGIINNTEGDELLSDHIPGLPTSVCKELAYQNASEAVEDAEKLMNLYNLEGEIPELNTNIQRYIQIPDCHVPLSRRVKEVISHDSFVRLANVTQLGFVSLLYPGANHSRYEHVLGTFARCCGYVKSLWYDQTSPLFRSLMTKQDIELALLSSLLHDIAQYSMAHDLTEISSDFEHEKFTDLLLQQCGGNDSQSMAEIVKLYWNVDAEDLREVLVQKKGLTFKKQIIRSLVNGPLDCDKVDYIKRDSIHLGVPFGSGFDADRLTKNLLLAYETRQNPDTKIVEISELGIGVSEKALAVAGGLWKARREMFTQVYWHHTVRAMKAMLGYIVRQTLIRISNDKVLSQMFWDEFIAFVAGHTGYKQFIVRNVDSLAKDDYLDLAGDPEKYRLASQLAIGDAAVLLLFERYAPINAQRIVDMLKQRRLFSRHTVISMNREKDIFSEIYQRFRFQRLEGNVEAIEKMRADWEVAIKKKVIAELKRRNKSDLVDKITNCEPLLFVDIPIKATSRVERDAALLFLPEEHSRRGASSQAVYPSYASTVTIFGEKSFDEQVGKIRVFVDPDWKTIMEQLIPQSDVREILFSN